MTYCVTGVAVGDNKTDGCTRFTLSYQYEIGIKSSHTFFCSNIVISSGLRAANIAKLVWPMSLLYVSDSKLIIDAITNVEYLH